MDVEQAEEPAPSRLELLKKYLSADGVVSSENRWWAGKSFDFKTNGGGDGETADSEHAPSAEVRNDTLLWFTM
jgi:hypothetical protein